MFGIEIIDAGMLPAMVVALVAGVVSFLSPCVLPIVPPYLAYMGGISLDEAKGRGRNRAVVAALFFVLGLSTVFLFLGFTASIFGQFFFDDQFFLAEIDEFGGKPRLRTKNRKLTAIAYTFSIFTTQKQ